MFGQSTGTRLVLISLMVELMTMAKGGKLTRAKAEAVVRVFRARGAEMPDALRALEGLMHNGRALDADDMATWQRTELAPLVEEMWRVMVGQAEERQQDAAAVLPQL